MAGRDTRFAATEDTDPGDLTAALVECFFSESDDAAADSYDRRLDRFETEARDRARTLLLLGAEAVAARIVDDLQRIRWSLLNLVGGTIELRIDRGDTSTIRSVTADGQVTCATL